MTLKATVHFPPAELQRTAWFASEAPNVIAAYRAGRSIVGPSVTLPLMLADDAAEEMFDLSNNPGRQDERDEKYGAFRSVSTGDIVAIEGGAAFICKSIGWEQI